MALVFLSSRQENQTYFHIEQCSSDVSCTNEHRVYFSNYIVNHGWIEQSLPDPDLIVSGSIASAGY